jgi:GNAT superfamily N-acetyltransferase
MEWIVRKATADDVEEIKRLMAEYITFYESPMPPDSQLNDLIQMLLLEEKGVQFIALQNGKALGFATLYYLFSSLRAQKVTEMNDLYVVESARGTKVAAALFEACKQYSQSQGFGFMAWKTARDNKRAQRFYEKMGGHAGDWIRYSIE